MGQTVNLLSSTSVVRIHPHPHRVTARTCESSSVDRALAFQAGGRGFESRFPLLCCFSSVVERILGKDEVPSSTLGSSSDRVENANSGYQSTHIRLVNGQTLTGLF